jgi:hypothetical protein
MESKELKNFKDSYLAKFISNKKDNLSNDENQNLNSDLIFYKDRINELYAEYQLSTNRYEINSGSYIKFVLDHLKKFKDNKDKDSFEAFKQMFLQFDFQKISNELQGQFNEGLKILEESINYFCSYTTKGLPEINSIYKKAVKNVFGINENKQFKEWRSTNYVAKLIVRYLNNKSLSYFFDEDKITNGENIKDKIYEYCGKAVTLVILAQPETFRDEVDVVNWCFEEYNHYTRTHEHLPLLIVYRIPDLGNPSGARLAIRDWYNNISTANGIKSTILDPQWPPSMIRTKVEADADLILDTYEKLFSDFKNTIN